MTMLADNVLISDIPIHTDPDLRATLRDRISPPGWHQRSLYTGDALLATVADSPYSRTQLHYQRLRQAAAITGACMFVSLGPGDAHLDKYILASLQSTISAIKYIPVDLNQLFLKIAIDSLCEISEIPFAVATDFETRLAFLRQLLPEITSSTGPMLVGLLGGTFGNLDLLETNFIAQVASITKPGDYLMFDIVSIGAGAPQPTATCDTPAVRRFLASGAARQTSTRLEVILNNYQRMRLSTGSSDVPETIVTLIVYDCPFNGHVPVLRFCQYNAAAIFEWASGLDEFEAIESKLCQPTEGTPEFGVMLLRRR